MGAAIPADPRDDPRLVEFGSLPLPVKMRAMGDLVAELRGWADRWEAEDRLRCVDDDVVDAVAGCLYAIDSQGMARIAPGRRIWTQMSEKAKSRSGHRAIARALLEHFDMRPRFALDSGDDDFPDVGDGDSDLEFA
ncbi:hypothetical protein [Mycobacterium avium]|uniref:hypothetical protein n=1 Tax=Mycobacterium avium TaxID=1764 RepID=UPI001CDA6D46|nr:hypothetical protein [Mycobacterium avium]MCA2338800.1 hypothetical protein [Mycobacterium avium]